MRQPLPDRDTGTNNTLTGTPAEGAAASSQPITHPAGFALLNLSHTSENSSLKIPLV